MAWGLPIQPGRQVGDVNNLEPARRRGGRNSFHDLAGLIRGAIVYSDHFVVVVFEGKQASERGFDVGSFVAGGNNDADARDLPGGLRSHSGPEMSAIFGTPIAASTRRQSQASPRTHPAIQWK